MTCVICRGQFCYTSFSGPFEPCDCGACLSADSVEDWGFVRACQARLAHGDEITDAKGNYIEPQEAE